VAVPIASRFGVLSNSIGLLVIYGASKATGIVMLAVLSRTLGVSGLGTYALILATSDLFRSSINGGFDQATARRIAAGELEPGTAERIGVIWKLAASLVATALAISLSSILRYGPTVVEGTALIGIDFFLNGIVLTLTARFNAELKSRVLIRWTLPASIGYLVIGLLGAMLHAGVLYFVLAIAANSALVVVLALPTIRHEIRRGKGPRFAGLSHLVREGLPLTALAILALTYTRIDTLIVGSISGTTQVGLYAAAYRLSEATYAVPFAVGVSSLAAVASGGRSTAEALSMVAGHLNRLLPIASVLSSGLWLFAPDIVSTLYGARYSPSSEAVVLLAGITYFVSVNNLTTSYLIAIGKRRSLLGIASIVLLVNVTITIIAVHFWGFVGAAAATTGTEIVNTALQVGLVSITARSWLLLRTVSKWLPMLLPPIVANVIWPGHVPHLAAAILLAVPFAAALITNKSHLRRAIKAVFASWGS
jgi:O-antigen/teichoic acid export membrane protein